MFFPDWSRWLGRLALAIAVGTATIAAEPITGSDLLQEMRNFRETGSVLYIAAHPDDENNRLLPFLARGRALRTGYLSLTRGDGGQNLIGPEQGERLGVIRTQELLAARRIDGAEQYFSRARDFGFSKDSANTLQRWDRNEVLADIVRVIRAFRPDVLITRFSPVPGNTHGHHTASAILALEAFKLAGDPKAFPEQLATLAVWQPQRILWNSFNPANFGPDPTPGVVRIEANGYDPLLGESFGEIGARGRTMHKSQGEGRSGVRGSGIESFQLLAGAPASRDILDGVDTSWGRLPGGAPIGPLADDLIAKFNPQNPVGSVPALLEIRRRLAELPADPLVLRKRTQLDHLLQGCLGLFVETTLPSAQVVPGEVLKLRHSVIVRTGYPVRWLGARYPTLKSDAGGAPSDLSPNVAVDREAAPLLPAETTLTQPYWLRTEGTDGMFQVAESNLVGRAENPPSFPVEQVFEIGGQSVVLPDEPVQVITDPVRGELRRRLEVIAPVSLAWEHDLELFLPGATKTLSVELTAARANESGLIQPEAPAGWTITPASQAFTLAGVGERARFIFSVTAPAQTVTAQISVRAIMGGRSYDRGRVEIRYDHIPVELLQPPARLKAVALDVAKRGQNIGYLPGAGDDIPAALRQLGYTVTELTGADLTPEKLRPFDAVVLGVRAFNTRTDLVPRLPALFAWVEGGGTVVLQYNRPGRDLKTEHLAPYPLTMANLRVTDQNAAMTLLAPDHPAFSGPNKITAADFDGWVQERGTYFSSQWDPRFTPLLACNDRGEAPLQGGLLVAHLGRGYFVYTGLSFFRQLPAGVPGAYRLFANLVSLGK